VYLQACDGECDGVGLPSIVVSVVPGRALQLKLNVDDGVGDAPAHSVGHDAVMKIMNAVRVHCIGDEVAEDGANH
jgi:hypothetical protein